MGKKIETESGPTHAVFSHRNISPNRRSFSTSSNESVSSFRGRRYSMKFNDFGKLVID